MYCDETTYAHRFGQEELDQVKETNGGLTYADAAAAADALVDSYLAAIPGRTFTLPLTTAPARVVGVAADLVRFELWANRASEEIRNRRDQAVEWLKDLVAGKAALLLADAPEAPQEGLRGRLGYASADRVFTATSLRGFIGEGGCD